MPALTTADAGCADSRPRPWLHSAARLLSGPLTQSQLEAGAPLHEAAPLTSAGPQFADSLARAAHGQRSAVLVTRAARGVWLLVHASVVAYLLLGSDSDLRRSWRGAGGLAPGLRRGQGGAYAYTFLGLLAATVALYVAVSVSDPGFVKRMTGHKDSQQAASTQQQEHNQQAMQQHAPLRGGSGFGGDRHVGAPITEAQRVAGQQRPSSGAVEKAGCAAGKAQAGASVALHATAAPAGLTSAQARHSAAQSAPVCWRDAAQHAVEPAMPSRTLALHQANTQGIWCPYCAGVQPLRARHCFKCGACVLRFDHHCGWVGNCVGAGNHRLFWWFLLSQVLLIAQSADATLSLWNERYLLEGGWGPFLAVMAVSAAVAAGLLLLSGLFLYHSYLAATGQTTLEHCYRDRVPYMQGVPEGAHPFSRGLAANLATFCFGGATSEPERMRSTAEMQRQAGQESFWDNSSYSCC